MVYLGRGVELSARKGYGRIVLGRWVHLGDGNRLRAHEGTLRIGDKTVLGRENTFNCYLDLHVGASCIVADWVYVCDFDHRTDDVRPADQGPGDRQDAGAHRRRRVARREVLGAAGRAGGGGDGRRRARGGPRRGARVQRRRGGPGAGGARPAGRPTRLAAAERAALADMARKARCGHCCGTGSPAVSTYRRRLGRRLQSNAMTAIATPADHDEHRRDDGQGAHHRGRRERCGEDEQSDDRLTGHLGGRLGGGGTPPSAR